MGSCKLLKTLNDNAAVILYLQIYRRDKNQYEFIYLK